MPRQRFPHCEPWCFGACEPLHLCPYNVKPHQIWISNRDGAARHVCRVLLQSSRNRQSFDCLNTTGMAERYKSQVHSVKKKEVQPAASMRAGHSSQTSLDIPKPGSRYGTVRFCNDY